MTNNIQTARRALAAIDLSAHVDAIALAEKQKQEIADAIEDGRRQIGELSQQIRMAKEGSVADPIAAGDALLAGEVPPSVDIEALYAQKAAIEAGMNDLRRREQGLADVSRRERQNAVSALATAAAPLLAEVNDMVQQAAQTLASAHAAAECIRRATANGNAAHLADRLADLGREMIRDQYLPASPVAVPTDIVDALSAAADQIEALRFSIPTEIHTFAPRTAAPTPTEPRREAGPSVMPDRTRWVDRFAQV